jgi:hypothetical protein
MLTRTRLHMATRMFRQSALYRPAFPMINTQTRSFSYGKQSYYSEVDDEPMEKLASLQQRYGYGQQPNAEVAEDYFKELNRQGKYMTVIRLYQQNESFFTSVRSPHQQKISNQYRYALENVEALEKALKEPRSNFMS